MGRAFLTLYGVTGDRQWLAHAEAAAKFIEATYKRRRKPATSPSKVPTDRSYTPKQQRDENIAVGPLRQSAYPLHRPTRKYKQMADYSMRYSVEPHHRQILPHRRRPDRRS